jgi:nucleoside-diphosphate-sugar epimerase
MTDPGSSEHLERNVSVSQTLIDTLFESGLSTFIFIGSINEYGSRSGCLTEDLPPEGRLTNYARGKAIVTSYGLEQSSRYGKTFISARLSYTYGPGQRSGSLLNKLYRCYHERVAPNLGPCEHFRDYIYVGEVAEGIKRLCGIQTSAIVNLGSGRCIQVKDLVQRFWVELGGLPDQLHFGASPMREGEPDQPYSYVSLEKLQELACWSPVLTIDEGVRLTIQSLDRERTAGQS